MPIYYQDNQVRLLLGDVLDVLRGLPDASVHCCVTSPPYWGLRDYGTGTWTGGDPDCDHKKAQDVPRQLATSTLQGGKKTTGHQQEGFVLRCIRCGAVREDKQLGMEPLHDCAGWATGERCGECFICHMTAVFSEIKRVLRPDGTCWLNIGDSYNGSGGAGGDYAEGGLKDGQPKFKGRKVGSLKPKDLCMIPSRLALALQADGWFVRSQIVWAKKAPMPESVQDRPTSAWEPIWLLTKSQRYYYDADAVREETLQPIGEAKLTGQHKADAGGYWTNGHGATSTLGSNQGASSRNSRNVWLLGPEPFPEAHFATFPTEIPRRAIKAGTSERGCCPACGAPWLRMREPTEEYAKLLGKSYHDHSGDGVQYGLRQNGKGPASRLPEQYRTVGWRPSCTCDAGEPVPCTVLDPFGGSCTTAMVAKELVRNAIAIDLNPAYLDLGIKRVQSAIPGVQIAMW